MGNRSSVRTTVRTARQACREEMQRSPCASYLSDFARWSNEDSSVTGSLLGRVGPAETRLTELDDVMRGGEWDRRRLLGECEVEVLLLRLVLWPGDRLSSSTLSDGAVVEARGLRAGGAASKVHCRSVSEQSKQGGPRASMVHRALARRQLSHGRLRRLRRGRPLFGVVVRIEEMGAGGRTKGARPGARPDVFDMPACML